jgi:hypothetical protein
MEHLPPGELVPGPGAGRLHCMKRPLSSVLLSFGLTVLGLASAASAQGRAQSAWRVGQALPHVHLPQIGGGGALDMAELRGKKVLLIEFASW